MSNAGIPVLGSVTLSGATNIQRKERDYIIEHQIAGKDGGLVERVGSASTRWEIKGFLREADADAQYQSIIALLGKSSNLSIPTFGSGYFLAASGTTVFVESFGGNWIPGVGYPRYDYTLKLVSTNKTQPAATTITSQLIQVKYAAANSATSIMVSYNSNVTAGDVLIAIGAEAADASALSVSDTQGNTWTGIDIIADTNTEARAWKTTAGSTGANTITFDSGRANTNFAVVIIEWQGTPTITVGKNNQASANLTNGIATQANGTLIVSVIAVTIGIGMDTLSFTGTIQAHSQPSQPATGTQAMAGSGSGTWSIDVSNPHYTEMDLAIS